jgi:hypothetical protein
LSPAAPSPDARLFFFSSIFTVTLRTVRASIWA